MNAGTRTSRLFGGVRCGSPIFENSHGVLLCRSRRGGEGEGGEEDGIRRIVAFLFCIITASIVNLHEMSGSGEFVIAWTSSMPDGTMSRFVTEAVPAGMVLGPTPPWSTAAPPPATLEPTVKRREDVRVSVMLLMTMVAEKTKGGLRRFARAHCEAQNPRLAQSPQNSLSMT